MPINQDCTVEDDAYINGNNARIWIIWLETDEQHTIAKLFFASGLSIPTVYSQVAHHFWQLDNYLGQKLLSVL